MKKNIHIYSIFIITIVLSMTSNIVMALDISKEMVIFKRIIGENIPGEKFIKHDYLAYDGKSDYDGKGDIRKSYKGAASNTRVIIGTYKNNIIQYVNVQVDKVVYLQLLPYVEQVYGEYISKEPSSLTSSAVKLNASLSGVKLQSSSIYAGTYRYTKRGINASLWYCSAIEDTNGKKRNEPNTTFSASID